ncbi:hypothetical protein MRB53_026710 [Persea americana]|uniref:Uncharacterized protein n=1 Tax=Persea americana TaxID=3435 RepID=A0ACC2LK15_PERAE|nr:hypothetical protein MRB53_026710 [Persea americana]
MGHATSKCFFRYSASRDSNNNNINHAFVGLHMTPPDREISSPSRDTPSNTVTLQIPQPAASYTIVEPVAHTPQAAVSGSSIDYTHSSPSTAVPSPTLAEPTTTSSPTHHHILTNPSTTVPCCQTLYDYKNSNWQQKT